MIQFNLMRCFLLISLLIFSVASNSSADEPWVLLSKGKGNNPDFYYNKESIKKIDHDVMEVYDSSVTPKGKTLRQIRIDCKNKKFAIGESDVYIGNNKVQSFDFSKNGWVWFDPSNNVERKLINAVCRKK